MINIQILDFISTTVEVRTAVINRRVYNAPIHPTGEVNDHNGQSWKHGVPTTM